VLGVRPTSWYDKTPAVPICTPFLKMISPVTATLSVDGAQVRFTWVGETAVATTFVGCDGGVTSGAAGVVADAAALCGDVFPAASYAAILYE
jgi:hypothetical protein